MSGENTPEEVTSKSVGTGEGSVEKDTGCCLSCAHYDRMRSWCKLNNAPTTPDYGCEDYGFKSSADAQPNVGDQPRAGSAATPEK